MHEIFRGFRNFILRGNVIDLAVAVIIGAAFKDVVTAIVSDLITPLLAALGGKPDFSRYYFAINDSKFLYGDFINKLISFLIISAIIYFFVIVPMNKIIERTKKGEKAGPSEKACPECLSLIPITAKRCKFCTSKLTNSK
ncbi:MAG TPA: large conductance mechanosensitive channel protein MscL [Candidatus Saccharimonadales bacterium]|nr:large conductance mechanosensitive channel protein MscL [Candidatus Saccharimonadales bacterium]